MPVKLAAGVLLGLIAYGGEEKLLRLLLLFFGVSCGMAGCVLGLGLLSGSGVPVVSGVFYTNVDAKVLLIAAASAYAVLSVVFREAGGGGTAASGEGVPLWTGGRVYSSLGQRQWPAGRKRAGGAGGGSRVSGPAVSS